ncbi:MAG: four helix bundle protein [Planctomycetes bacterium]|nr:four helix bundle protein [Planctomycetota bacterium]MBU4400820.1 four helix bundle protein [Planctomycetota bacterium]MCG2682932.1 four helix bundle protein [Planctomycetales bacterium]
MNREQSLAKEDACLGQTDKNRKFDLAERTACFGERIVVFARTIKLDAVTRPLVTQLVRAGTSVGANYCEANEAGSRKEFRYRISICNREARESKHWLRMLAAASTSSKETSRVLWKEAHELNLIFSSIFRNTKIP